MSVPQVSVLIPVYNGEPFLAECLDSVLAQDLGVFEVLISDDCSRDASAAVIRRFAERDPRIRWWTNPRNLGISANCNACLREARADLIKFVLQDDKLLDVSALRRMADQLNSDKSVSLVVSASQRIDSESRVIRLRNCFGETAVRDGKQAILRCFEANANLIGEPSLVMFRKSQALRGFNERLSQLMDLEMWFHLLEQGRMFYIADPLCAFREHPAQLSEVNRRTGASDGEALVLAESYYARPWMKESVTPRSMFMLMYNLRKQYGEKAAPLRAEMMRNITTPVYAGCWFRYKTTRPFKNLWRWLGKRKLVPSG